MRFIASLLTVAVAAASWWTAARWPESAPPAPDSAVLAESNAAPPRFREVAHLITAEVWDGMLPRHQAMFANLARRDAAGRPMFCLHGPVSDATRIAFETLVYGDPNLDLQTGQRWTATATNPSVPSPGAEITVTWSFVPDGTLISGGAGEPAGPSDLLARFDATFGNRTTWQNLFAQVFARWGELSGITYVFEPNDDGVAIGTSAGVRGVRGDVRIGGHSIDGGSGILAYNNFPLNGDMVIDTDDMGLYGQSANNFRFLRNTLAHEHGHGMGIFHVCPRTNTKLMEPFISTSFDGPQLDDILSAQRLYGDRFEPNDTAGTASDLGSLNLGLTALRDVSCDASNDADWYRFTAPAGRAVTISLRPRGATYLEGPQTSACNTGTSINTLAFNDISVQLIDVGGLTVLANANLQPAGQNEVISNFFLPSGAGQYFVRVLPGAVDAPQLYDLDITLIAASPPAYAIEFPNGIPATVTPGQSKDIAVRIVDGAGTIDPATAVLRVTPPAGTPITTIPLLNFGNGAFIARLPAILCNSSAQWWIETRPLGSPATLISSPNGAPVNRYTTRATGVTVFNDDFDTNLGWAVTNSATLTDGAWQRGVPVGNGTRGDPATAFGGSGSAYLTANRTGNSDVDGGTTTLTSPVLALASAVDPAIEVAIWYSNNTGSNPNEDPFLIEISGDNGVNYVRAETYNANAGAWVERRYRVLDFLPALTNTVRVRFIAQDLGVGGSVVEAGVDAFRVVTCGAGATGPALTDPCAAGTFTRDLLAIDWITGDAARRVEIPRVLPVRFHLASPTGQALPFVLFGKIGVAAPADRTSIGIGDMCFAPCFLQPFDPTLFTLVDGLGGFSCAPPLLPAGPAPWTFELPAAGVALDVTVQGVVLTGQSSAVITNAILFRWL